MQPPPPEFAYIPYPPGHCCDRSGRVFRWVRDCWELVPVHVGDTRFNQPYVRLVTPTISHGKFFRVRELMAAAWLGPKPSPEHYLRIIDGNKRNAALDNMRWETHAQRLSKYLRPRMACKLTTAQVIAARQHARDHGYTRKWAAAEAKRLGLSSRTLAHAVNGRSWKHLDATHPPTPPGVNDLRVHQKKVLKGCVVHVRSKLTPGERSTITRRLENGERISVVHLSYPQVSLRTIYELQPRRIRKCQLSRKKAGD